MPGIGKDDGERKQVTVLFADVSGSMDLAEGQDPEEWRKIMQRFFAILAGAVERFEGTVDKFTGDGIMAVFGAPVAHEDHARRACYAALQMLDDVAEYAGELRRGAGLNFSTRIGINSGEVVAGAIGAGGEGEYTAIGHTVGLAQRMEALAEPGKAYLTENAAELVRGFMELADLGQFEIKGASQPVRVFELAGVGSARSRLDLSRARGFSRFVGREEEMAVLEKALGRAEAGEGAAVGIVAEAGVGKSRLSHEFAELCRERGLEVFEAQAQSHGQSMPLMPVLQMLRAYFGIGDRDPERLTREKIAGRALLLDPEFSEELPLVFDFLGVPDPERPVAQMSPEARQRALGRVVCRLLNAPNRRHTVVMVVEDLHWIDEGSEAMLAELIRSIEGTRTLAVVNFRPEYPVDWGEEATYRSISLEPLGQADTREMLRDLAGVDPSLDGLEEPIHERTAGNPFFVEEIVRELVEAGHFEGKRGAYRLVRPVEEAGVPATVQAVLAARIDRLDPAAKQLLQIASVVGKEVGARALGLTAGLGKEELDPAICELVDGGFLYEAELYPERVLAFRHPLTREVAYGTQLGDRRAATHSAAARAMIELEPERLDELAALVANHLEAGGETREAARWSARAAYWAGSSQPREAMRLWQVVMRLAGELEEDDEAAALAVTSRLLQLDFAWRLGMDSEEERRLADEAEKIAKRTGDLRSLALLRMATGARPGIPHRADTWVAAAEEANRLADESGDHHLRVAIRAATAYALLCSGDFAGFDRTLGEVLDLAGDDRTAGAGVVIGNPVAWALMGKGMVRKERGELAQAEELLEAALRTADEMDDPETTSWIRGTQAMLRSARGDLDGGVAMARRNCELTERLGDVFSRSLARANLCAAELAAGDFAAALASIEAADRLYLEAMGDGGEMEAWRGALRAQALLGAGNASEAIEVAERAANIARDRGMLWPLPLALQALGRALVAAGRDGAREALDEAAAVAQRTGALASLAEIDADRVDLAAVAGH
ncbi:MAG TPA: adenylate/guanylate cyclase domain-containing protein [Solirubrobacterales bacterium]|jgi:adenylate cyclase|nr:adenylate/guanylate cyclase domain-containing protein [Solirubrobacterales bacterium]